MVDAIRSPDQYEADNKATAAQAAAARAEGHGQDDVHASENGQSSSGFQSSIPDHSGSETPPSPTSSESSWTTIEAQASEIGTDLLGDENAEMYADLLKDVDARNKGKAKSASPTIDPATTNRTFIFSLICVKRLG